MVRRLQRALRLFIGCSRRLHQNSTGAIHQFFIGGPQIHHQIFIRFPHANHGGGAQHVQHHLLRSPRLEACRTGQHFRSRLHLDGYVGDGTHAGGPIAGKGDRPGPDSLRILECPDHVRGPSTGADPDNGIPLLEAQAPQIPFPGSGIIFGALFGLKHRFLPPCQQGDRQAGIDAEGGRQFRGVQHPQPPARSGPHINQATSRLEGCDDGFHRLGDGRKDPIHRLGNGLILRVHQSNDLQGGHLVQPEGFFIFPFRRQTLQWFLHPHHPLRFYFEAMHTPFGFSTWTFFPFFEPMDSPLSFFLIGFKLYLKRVIK